MTTSNCEHENCDQKANEKQHKFEEILLKLTPLPELKKVKNKKDKGTTYKFNMKRYELARSQKFYFEALLIVYGYIEDRLYSFLYHCGLLKTIHSRNINCQIAKTFIASLFNVENNIYPSIRGVGKKIIIIQQILTWVKNNQNSHFTTPYEETLYKHIQTHVEVSNLLQILEILTKWTALRDKYVHPLMSNNTSSMNDNIEKIVEQGMIIAQYLASQVSRLKAENDAIRKVCNLGNN